MVLRIRYLIILLYCFATFSCKTPSSILLHNTEETWGNVNYISNRQAGLNAEKADIAFMMVSNRHFTEGALRFADNQTDTAQIHLLYVCKKNNKWFVYEMGSLREGIEKLPVRNWVLYTEGMGKIFTSNMERAHFMTAQYGVNVILFDYASIMDEKGVSKNYKFARRNAAASHRQYVDFLSEIARLKSTSLFSNVAVSIFIHSLGHEMFREMMKQDAYKVFGGKKFIDNVILNAACTGRKEHERWVQQIDFAKHVYIHFNRQDRNLNGATFLTWQRMLGTKPKKPLAKNAIYIDFNEAVHKEHSYFLNFPDRPFVLSEHIKSYYGGVLNGRYVDAARDYEKSRIAGYKMKR